MRKIATVLAAVVGLGWAPAAQAQMQRPAPTGQAQPSAQRPPQHQMGGHGMMEHQGMMEMMCPMMMGMMMGNMMSQGGMGRGTMGRGMMGPGMMGQGMTGMQGMANLSDPKAMARRLRLRGDMMKAMSEVLLKHAQELEQEK
jgi:hypothetical protein